MHESSGAESLFIDNEDDIFFGFNQEHELINWNAELNNVTGYSNSELSGMHLDDLFNNEINKFKSSIPCEDESNTVVETNISTADGEKIAYKFKLYSISGDSKIQFGSLGRKISEDARYENSYEQEIRMFRNLCETTADPELEFYDQIRSILRMIRSELDISHGILTDMDTNGVRFEVVSSDSKKVTTDDLLPRPDSVFEETLNKTGVIVFNDLDAENVSINGKYWDGIDISSYIGFPVIVDGYRYGTLSFFDSQKREFSDWVVSFIDLVGRWISHELDHHRTRERLELQNERLERFATILSHNLRNPLNVVIGRADMLSKTGDKDHLDAIKRSTNRMEDMISNILLLARSGNDIEDMESISIKEASTECWENIDTKQAELNIRDDKTITADSTRLRQLLMNLFKNAVEHGSDDVSINVGSLQPIFTSTRASTKGMQGFYVEDNGDGIKSDIQDSVFKTGYTTSTNGTGLGLAIIKEICESHGWDVELKESSSGGARFEFTNISTKT